MIKATRGLVFPSSFDCDVELDDVQPDTKSDKSAVKQPTRLAVAKLVAVNIRLMRGGGEGSIRKVSGVMQQHHTATTA